MADLAAGFAVVAETFAEASTALNYDLWGLVASGPEERLNQTEVTQPAMLAADIATWRVWRRLGGPQPDFLAGHSLGEYAALVAANAIDFVDAVGLVAQRGKLMQEATPEGTGGMAAVLGLDDEDVRRVCEEVSGGEVVSCANYNSPGQVVIAGQAQAVARACEAAKVAGARKAIVLPVSVPSHCALMKPAAEALASALAEIEIKSPDTTVLHNVDARPRVRPEDIREALVAQLWQPVLWTATVQRLASENVNSLAECGPGRVLAGLCRRISKELSCAALTDGDVIRSTITQWSEA